MQANLFRKLALSLPEAAEASHMNHPDFRVGGKIFATLSPHGEWAMVKLTPQQQHAACELAPTVFEPFPNAWGRQGCTKVHLARATKGLLWPQLLLAWQNAAPKRLRANS